MPKTRKAGRRSYRRRNRRGKGSRKDRRRKNVPWRGWSKIAPQGHARTVMLRDCGKKCFLGPRKSFPICAKGTCRINKKGVYAAYVRAREWGNKKSSYKGKARPTMERRVYTRVAREARRMLRERGALRGGKRGRKTCKRKRLVGQKRNRAGKIVKHGHYKC